MNDGAMLWGDAMHDEAMGRCDARGGDAMDDERWGDAMGRCNAR